MGQHHVLLRNALEGVGGSGLRHPDKESVFWQRVVVAGSNARASAFRDSHKRRSKPARVRRRGSEWWAILFAWVQWVNSWRRHIGPQRYARRIKSEMSRGREP